MRTCPRCGKPVVFVGGNKRIMVDRKEKFMRIGEGRKKAVTVDGREVRGAYCRKDDPCAVLVYIRHNDTCANPPRFDPIEYRKEKERKRYLNRRMPVRREPERIPVSAAASANEQMRLF